MIKKPLFTIFFLSSLAACSTHQQQSPTYKTEIFPKEKHHQTHERLLSKLGEVDGCKPIPENHRAYCPFEEEDIYEQIQCLPDGVQLVLASEKIGGTQDIQEHVNCHLGARSQLDQEINECPLYLQPITVNVSGDKKTTTVLLSSTQLTTTTLLQAWAEGLRSKGKAVNCFRQK